MNSGAGVAVASERASAGAGALMAGWRRARALCVAERASMMRAMFGIWRRKPTGFVVVVVWLWMSEDIVVFGVAHSFLSARVF